MIMNPLVIIEGGTNKHTKNQKGLQRGGSLESGIEEEGISHTSSQSSCSGEEEEEPELLCEPHSSVLQSALGLAPLIRSPRPASPFRSFFPAQKWPQVPPLQL